MSYAKARAEGLGLRADVGLAERAERLILVLLGTAAAGFGFDTALAEAADTLIIPELNLTLTLVQIYEEAGVVPMKAGFEAEEAE